MTRQLLTLALIALITCTLSTQAAEAPESQDEAKMRAFCLTLPQEKHVVRAAKKGDPDMAVIFLLGENNGRKTLRGAKRAMQQRAGQEVADFIFDDPLVQPKQQ